MVIHVTSLPKPMATTITTVSPATTSFVDLPASDGRYYPDPPTCSAWPPVEADPDIAGTGVGVYMSRILDRSKTNSQVLTSFMLSAYATLGLVVVHFLLDHHVTSNPVDRRFINLFTPRAWNNDKSVSKKRTEALEGAVLMYSDTQIITGLAILLAGYIQLPSGISSYHWQIVVDLAWFSSLSHLTTLTALRGYFRRRTTMAICRAVLVGKVFPNTNQSF